MDDVDPRFRGTYQLLGSEHFGRIRAASVCVVGLGGVGSWSVEALARSGVGSLTLVDLDEVCVTNINRQIHALTDTVGRSKAELLAERVLAINPQCKVQVVRKFFSLATADEILGPGFDIVLDTIDRNENKTTLIGECVKRSLRVVTVGAGGDRKSAANATATDLARTIHDPLLQIVRKQLRQEYGFPKGERTLFNVPCVYVPNQRGPRKQDDKGECGVGAQGRKSCNDGLGSAVYVTGVLGFMAAGEVIRLLAEEKAQS
jgi:tRNA A37 threonylcarbamoyladenosine dehydratase